MKFKYVWKNKEANFGKPLPLQVKGGTHITFEIILKRTGRYIALRRKSIPGHEAPPHAKKYPKGLLYFCHNLIRYGESVEQCVKRIVKTQTGVSVKSYKVVDIESSVQRKDGQWAIVPLVVAELTTKPKVGNFGNQIIEVVEFTRKNVPADFAWWSKSEVELFLKKIA
jgi:ADP-ribose pyrophosphatase YjhB (NUDIX family)